MKLPHITKDMYFWNGDTSQLRSYIRRWDKEFSKHSPNIVVPFIRSLVSEFYQWRLNKARTFQDCVNCLMVLVSSEDVYVQKLEAEIRAHPKCRNLTEDKEYLNFLSMKVTQLLDIQPNYVVTSAQCTGFFSKIHCSTQVMNLNTELENRKREANDVEGLMNYERSLQEMIVHQIKLIDKPLVVYLQALTLIRLMTHILKH